MMKQDPWVTGTDGHHRGSSSTQRNIIAELVHAAANNKPSLVRRLIASSTVDVNALDKDGMIAVRAAASEGDVYILEILTLAGADLMDANLPDLNQAIHLAAQKGHAHVLRFLLDQNGVDVDAVNADEETALHLASQQGHYCCIDVLTQSCKHKPDPFIYSQEGKCAYDLACTNDKSLNDIIHDDITINKRICAELLRVYHDNWRTHLHIMLLKQSQKRSCRLRWVPQELLSSHIINSLTGVTATRKDGSKSSSLGQRMEEEEGISAEWGYDRKLADFGSNLDEGMWCSSRGRGVNDRRPKQADEQTKRSTRRVEGMSSTNERRRRGSSFALLDPLIFIYPLE